MVRAVLPEFTRLAGSHRDLLAVGVILCELLGDHHHPYPHTRPMADEPTIEPEKLQVDLTTRFGARPKRLPG